MNLTATMIDALTIDELCSRFEQHDDLAVRQFAERVRDDFADHDTEVNGLNAEISDLEKTVDGLELQIEQLELEAKA